jgi:hypothetical protein
MNKGLSPQKIKFDTFFTKREFSGKKAFLVYQQAGNKDDFEQNLEF